MRMNPICALLPLLAACVQTPPQPVAQPLIYASVAEPGAVLNADAARDIINAYRQNKGLTPVVLDAVLMTEASRQVAAMAAGGDVSRGARTDIRARLAAAGLGQRQSRESVSAGYFTISDAFSGWRGSPVHDATLTLPHGRRMGIAAEHRAGSRHNVYWSLIISD
jgi:uncharacterized protein YkwD